jgi:hypothetical protein
VTAPARPALPDGLVAFVKRACPTCVLVAPVLAELAKHAPVTVYAQDDPSFPDGVARVDDGALEVSWHCEVETVPTLLRVEGGREVARAIGWHRGEWEALAGVTGLGAGLPEWRPAAPAQRRA